MRPRALEASQTGSMSCLSLQPCRVSAVSRLPRYTIPPHLSHLAPTPCLSQRRHVPRAFARRKTAWLRRSISRWCVTPDPTENALRPSAAVRYPGRGRPSPLLFDGRPHSNPMQSSLPRSIPFSLSVGVTQEILELSSTFPGGLFFFGVKYTRQGGTITVSLTFRRHWRLR